MNTRRTNGPRGVRSRNTRERETEDENENENDRGKRNETSEA